MVEQLFGSKTRVKLLKLFYSNPNRSFYVREITRKVEEQINSVRRELSNLLSLGIISSEKSDNNRLYYEVDQKYEHYDPLSQMFGVKTKEKAQVSSSKKTDTSHRSKKTDDYPSVVPKVELAEAEKWEGVGNISGIAYSGAYTRDASALADIVVVGDVNIAKVESVIVELEKEKNTELRYAVFELEEWKYRRQVHDKFYSKFMDTKKQIVLDKDGLFDRV